MDIFNQQLVPGLQVKVITLYRVQQCEQKEERERGKKCETKINFKFHLR